MLSEWIPRFIFIAVAVWIGWQVISFYVGYIKGIQEIIAR
jgi:hypothetical protein